jgi:hypothetical protein
VSRESIHGISVQGLDLDAEHFLNLDQKSKPTLPTCENRSDKRRGDEKRSDEKNDDR